MIKPAELVRLRYAVKSYQVSLNRPNVSRQLGLPH